MLHRQKFDRIYSKYAKEFSRDPSITIRDGEYLTSAYFSEEKNLHHMIPQLTRVTQSTASVVDQASKTPAWLGAVTTAPQTRQSVSET